MKTKIIACEVMKEEMLSIEALEDVEIQFVSMDNHLYPKKLNRQLQAIIDTSLGYDKIILAFGLCGGAVKGLIATNCPIIIPRVHDCIAVFLTATDDCVCNFKKEVGTFYLSCGWMITERSILSDHHRILDKYGEKKALSILNRMYDSYKKVLFICTDCSMQDKIILESKQIAKLINVKHEMIKGKIAFIEKIVRGPWDDKNFINIEKSGIIIEEDFGI